MPRIMITCPITGKPANTGMSMDKPSFEDSSNTMNGNSFMCPLCKTNHKWDKKDAYLEGEKK